MDPTTGGKVDPEEAGKTQPRRDIVAGLAALLLLLTCAVVAGGLLAHFRANDGHKRFRIQASVRGQTVREEVEFDRQTGTAVYRDASGAEEGEVIQTRGGLAVFYWQGGCYLLENSKNNGTRELDIASAEAAIEALDANPMPPLEGGELVFLNKSVPIGAEDDVTLRAELPPICGDAPLYRVQGEDTDVEISTVERVDRTKRGAFCVRVKIVGCSRGRWRVIIIIC